MTLKKGGGSGTAPIVHTGHEFVYCLAGRILYTIEDETFLLNPGDSLLFAAQLKHRWRNPGKTVTTAMFVLSAFEQDERPSEFHITSGQQSLIDDDPDEPEGDDS